VQIQDIQEASESEGIDMIGNTRAGARPRFLAGSLGLVVLVGLALAPQAGAAPVYLSTVQIDCFSDRTTVSGPVPSLSETCAAFGTTAAANVASDVGVIRSHATATRNSGTGTGARAQGVARFQDSFLVTALDSVSNSVLSGFLTVIVDVDAPVTLPETLCSSCSFLGSVQWNFSVGSGSQQGRTLLTMGSGTTGGHFALQIPWAAGTPIDILFFANLQTSVVTLGTATGTGDFIIPWGGISAVTDSNGVPVQSFTALNSEGFDYALAVPEPTSGILLGLGLGALLTVRRRIAEPADD